MKKLLLILLCLPMIGFGQFTMIPDANFEQRLISFGYDNILDGTVLTSAIDTVTELQVAYYGISDLTGIEDFTALTYLNCAHNNLTSLNISNNTALDTLLCQINQLTSLDVSQNTALTFLLCHNNQLTSLNLRNGNNYSFTDFNATNNPNLQCIDIDNVAWADTNWTVANGSIDSTMSFSTNCAALLFPSIGLTSIPNDSDSVCTIIPRNQGNTWNTINPGDTMADFKLWDINGDSVILSEVLNSGKRVLMVSGSYTCPIFRDHMTELNAVAAQFGNQIECFVVYTVEAHPTGSPMPYSGNINPTNPPYYQPNTYGERKTILQDMLNGVGTGSYIPVPINVPIYIDGPCNEWWEYYNGPNNAYLIDTNGILFAYHNWFSNSNPPNGQATNIWCDIDSLLNVSSGGCSTITNTNGTFNFQLKPTSSAMSFGNPGDIIDVFGEIINTSTNGVQVDIRRVMNNLPSPTWSSSMCVTFCLPASQDTTSVLVGAGDTLDFSFHFFTDVLMNGPDTGRARVRFTNTNGNQQSITQNYRGITYAQTTSISEDDIQNRRLDRLIDLSGKESKKRSNRIQIYIYEDGTIEKRIIVE